MAATILAESGVTLYFGVDAGIVGISGYIANDSDQDNASKTAEAADDQGSTVAVAFFDQMVDIKVNALLVSGTSVPVPGSTVSITGALILPAASLFAVMKASIKEKNNGFTMATLDLRRWTDNAIPN